MTGAAASGAAEGTVAASDTGYLEPQWRGLVRVGAGSAVFVVLMIPIQATVFILSPPPTSVEQYFALFQKNPFLGLLDLDLLLTLDYLVMIPLYLGLYALLRKVAQAWALLALVVGLFGLVLFVVSREATLSMWLLSDQYAAASSTEDKAALLAAGQALLTLYNGGTFATSYLLGAASTLIFSFTMLRQRVFGRLPGVVGIVTGLTMLLPANAGEIGLTMSLLSLIPTAVWLVLLARHMLRVSRRPGPGAHGERLGRRDTPSWAAPA